MCELHKQQKQSVSGLASITGISGIVRRKNENRREPGDSEEKPLFQTVD